MSIKSRFCVKCGKQNVALVDSTCIDCLFYDLELKVPKKVTLIKCKQCGAINFEGIWIEAEQPNDFYFENLLIKKIKLPIEAELENIKIEEVGEKAKISATTIFHKKKFTKNFEVEFETLMRTCESCSIRKRKHYEAKIQLRIQHKEELAEMLELIKEFKTHILKIEHLPDGIDVFLTSKEAARHLATELRKDFDLWTKESGEAYGWDKFKNRPRYKLIILMRERG